MGGRCMLVSFILSLLSVEPARLPSIITISLVILMFTSSVIL